MGGSCFWRSGAFCLIQSRLGIPSSDWFRSSSPRRPCHHRLVWMDAFFFPITCMRTTVIKPTANTPGAHEEIACDATTNPRRPRGSSNSTSRRRPRTGLGGSASWLAGLGFGGDVWNFPQTLTGHAIFNGFLGESQSQRPVS